MSLAADRAYLPRLLRSPAVWLPAIASIGSTVLFLLVQPLGSNGLANGLFQVFALPPALGAILIAAIVARRARYLAGAIAAVVGALAFSFAVVATPVDGDTVPAIIQAILLSAVFGAAIGAFFDGVAWLLLRVFRPVPRETR